MTLQEAPFRTAVNIPICAELQTPCGDVPASQGRVLLANPSYYPVEVDGYYAQCSPDLGCDCSGNDLIQPPVDSVEECANACDTTAGCAGFVVDTPNSGESPPDFCWLKTTVASPSGPNNNRLCYIPTPAAGTPMVAPAPAPAGDIATGGMVTTYTTATGTTAYVNTFTKPTGTLTINADAFCNILLVAGGGGAGLDSGGGGGGGGVLSFTNSFMSAGSYPVTVGQGGMAATGYGANGMPGGNTALGTLAPAVGGAGGYDGHAQITAPTVGGSGGGGGMCDGANQVIVPPGSGTPGQGFGGGAGAFDAAGGGGVGAGEPGTAASGSATIPGVSGNGGAGLASDITGTVVYYGGAARSHQRPRKHFVSNVHVSPPAHAGGGSSALLFCRVMVEPAF